MCVTSDFKSVELFSIDSFQLFSLFGKSSNHENAKIDVNKMKDFYMSELYFKRPNEEIAMEIDDLKIVQTILSKQIPPELYNGIVNFLYMLTNPNTTSEEIGSNLVMRVKLENVYL